ncbi:MAG: lytic transglycosylase domain-containing protein [Candidatus Competibacteraceae bacterium]|jgi:soluble lytic murein transglycosylase-like protein|nr:lytic transglycosylase domain-containing protein [Candidatus Competibacteraceae bacterium]
MPISKPLPGSFGKLVKVGFLTVCIATPMATCLAESHSSTQNGSFELAAVKGARSHQMRQRNLSQYIQKTYRVRARKADTIVNAAFNSGARYDVAPELILAIIAVESTFRAQAVGPKGSRGLMQVLPRAHPRKVRAIGGVKALFDPNKNIRTGSKILSDYLRKSGGNLRKGLLRYNGSYGTRSRYADKVLRVYSRLKKINRGTQTSMRSMPVTVDPTSLVALAAATTTVGSNGSQSY